MWGQTTYRCIYYATTVVRPLNQEDNCSCPEQIRSKDKFSSHESNNIIQSRKKVVNRKQIYIWFLRGNKYQCNFVCRSANNWFLWLIYGVAESWSTFLMACGFWIKGRDERECISRDLVTREYSCKIICEKLAATCSPLSINRSLYTSSCAKARSAFKLLRIFESSKSRPQLVRLISHWN